MKSLFKKSHRLIYIYFDRFTNYISAFYSQFTIKRIAKKTNKIDVDYNLTDNDLFDGVAKYIDNMGEQHRVEFENYTNDILHRKIINSNRIIYNNGDTLKIISKNKNRIKIALDHCSAEITNPIPTENLMFNGTRGI